MVGWLVESIDQTTSIKLKTKRAAPLRKKSKVKQEESFGSLDKCVSRGGGFFDVNDHDRGRSAQQKAARLRGAIPHSLSAVGAT